MDAAFREKAMKFCIVNSEPMQKWLERYELAKETNAKERAQFQRNRSTRFLPLPESLRPLPPFPTSRWLDTAVSQAKATGEDISEEEEELAKGCDWEYIKYGALWSHGRHFRIARIDQNRSTFDSGVMVNFLQKSRASGKDDNSLEGELDYCGVIQDILKLSLRKFDYFVFDVKWFKVVTSGRKAIVRRDKSGLLQVNSTRLWTDERDTFVLPEHREQVVFIPDSKEREWLFVLQVAPRSIQIFEIIDVEESPSLVDSEIHSIVEEEEIIVREEEVIGREDEAIDDDQEETSIESDLEAINIEIDILGASDLQEDARLEDF
ncbi:hypothetical protein KP509_11G014100 [Ceratopteris richardii]|uniref:DUF4216 domain-containing protein n=1 Tax=Ceratopteris richardii TaxID=49495 RepID=A0A8T2TS59_CERRI|nr:hypothetical protein KP509_11G014100 [Ceratopteris richardii]